LSRKDIRDDSFKHRDIEDRMNRVYKFWKMEGEQMDARLYYNLVKALIFPE